MFLRSMCANLDARIALTATTYDYVASTIHALIAFIQLKFQTNIIYHNVFFLCKLCQRNHSFTTLRMMRIVRIIADIVLKAPSQSPVSTLDLDTAW
jgi:uncharacterized membrane protein YcgQ (UPF0703/DUF1980 family)